MIISFYKKIPFKVFVSVVTSCDIFIRDINASLALICFDKIDFSLNIKLYAYFSLFFVFIN